MKIIALALMAICSNSLANSSGTSFPNTTTWVNHYAKDILPYWKASSALGWPIGNFPTFRDMNGNDSIGSPRYTRMISRQVYTYLIGFNLTGEDSLFIYAKSGIDWILTHAKDSNRGFFSELDSKGKPISKFKSAQDMAYITNAFATFYYVTRDSASDAITESMSDLISKGKFYDNDNGLIRDALTNSLDSSVEFESPGTDLVSLLDQVNAYLVLYTNQQRLGSLNHINNLKRLKWYGDKIIDNFYYRGIFWNTNINRTNYNAKHVDAGHTLKTFWMIYRIDQMWAEEFGFHIYSEYISIGKKLLLESAEPSDESFWGTKFEPDLGIVKGNPDWWIQIEQDQFAADLSVRDKLFVGILNGKSQNWLKSNFIDRTRSVHGIRNGIKWDNSLYGNDDAWKSKANEWKNGYHETEHCIVLHVTSHAITNDTLTLYFALKNEADINSIQPYLFKGKICSWEKMHLISGTTLVKFKVKFLFPED